ncbi:MAG: competence/damage-inducible protein A [Myxococcales bacterium]|nr:competence/damage-inducible protein A [Myxococcales bacterium]
MTPAPTAAVLLIGNELLSGKVQDANLVVLARDLRALGVRLTRVVMVEDVREVIRDEVRALASTHDWLVTSGGVGPTHDDVTLAAVADAFSVGLERREEIAALLRGFYGARCTEGHLCMADLPIGTELLSEADGPEGDVVEVGGKKLPWPAFLVRNVFCLPGIPQIFQMKLGAIRARLRKLGASAFVSRGVLTDMDEGNLKPLLDAVVAQHPEVEIGSYPAWIGAPYRTKLTFDGRDAARVDAALEAFVATLPAGEPKGRV